MSRLDTIANWLSVIAAFAFAGAVVLPDTVLGSPRSIVMSAAGVVVAVVQLLHTLANYRFKMRVFKEFFDTVMQEIEHFDYPRGGVNASETAKSPS